MTKSTSHWSFRLSRAGVAAGVVAAAIVGVPAPALAASATLTLSSTVGSTLGTNTITASSTAAAAYLNGVTAPVATFSMPACQTVYNATASTAVPPTSTTAGNVLVVTTNKVSNAKATILVPALAMAPSGATSTKYNLCVYASSSATAPLVGSATYTVASAPVFPVSPVGIVTPASGPALGGSAITITATSGLPTAAGSITATLGGVALTSITPVSATSFTAVTPAHAPGVVTLNVTTAAGTKSITSAYTYANGITISPNTAPATSAAVYVDVLGAGFMNYTFGTAATNARVWLVSGVYEPGVAAATTYVNGPTAECVVPVVISDNELICKLNLLTGELTPSSAAALSAPVPDGTYTLTVASNGDPDGLDPAAVGYLQTDLSSGATFTVAPY